MLTQCPHSIHLVLLPKMKWSFVMHTARSVFTRAANVTPPTKGRNSVIALFGWAGAKDVHLEKYSQLYNQRGYDTVRFISEFNGEWRQTARGLKYSRDVSPVIEDIRSVLGNRDNSIAFHLLSMNGVYTLCSLHLQYPELDILGRTSGIFFDSAPVYFDYAAIATFQKVLDYSNMELLTSGDSWRVAKYQAWRMALGWKMAAQIAVKRLSGVDPHVGSPFHFLRDHAHFPKLLSFVYSDGDVICPAKFTAEFIDFQRTQRNADVDELHLRDSKHVMHLRKYPVEYNAMIDRFLERISGGKSKI